MRANIGHRNGFACTLFPAGGHASFSIAAAPSDFNAIKTKCAAEPNMFGRFDFGRGLLPILNISAVPQADVMEVAGA